ncbi:MAG: GtrA family protein [Ferruginibacter sp.]
MKKKLNTILDFFYPPFRRILPIQTFRYAVCGGSNTLLGLAIYFVCLNYVFRNENADLQYIVFKPHNAALFTATSVCFFTGFLLNKYLVFIDSHLRGRIQLFRYFVSFAINLVINYFLLKVFVEVWHVDPFLAQIITTFMVIGISYISQRHFTFRSKKPLPE